MIHGGARRRSREIGGVAEIGRRGARRERGDKESRTVGRELVMRLRACREERGALRKWRRGRLRRLRSGGLVSGVQREEWRDKRRASRG